MPLFFNQNNRNQNNTNQNNYAQSRNQNRSQNQTQSQPQNPMFFSPFFQNNKAQSQNNQQNRQPMQQRQQQPTQQRQQQNKSQDNKEGYKNLGGFNPNNLPDGIRLSQVNPNAVSDLQQMLIGRGNIKPTEANENQSKRPTEMPSGNTNNLQMPSNQDNITQANTNTNTNINNTILQSQVNVSDMLKRFIQNERNCERFYSQFAEDVSNEDIKRRLELYSKQSKDNIIAYSNILNKRNENYSPEDKNIIKGLGLQEGLVIAVREELEALSEFGELYSIIMDYTEKNILSKILIDKFVRINVMMSYRGI